MRGKLILLQLLILSLMLLNGCWDYKEINKLSIVAGVAADRSEAGKYNLTFEIVDLHDGGEETKIKSRLIESEGESIFDAIRNVLRTISPKPYFGHMDVLILSESVAKEGIASILDFLNRDAEPRLNVDLLISSGKTAKDILSTESLTTAIRSIEIENLLDAQEILSISRRVKVYEFVNELPCNGIAPVLPVIKVTESSGVKTSLLSGTAVFRGDKMVGYLNEEESRYYCYLTNNVKGGLIVLEGLPNMNNTDISLELYACNTITKPIYTNGKISMDISINAIVSLAEQGSGNSDNSEISIQKIQKAAEDYLKDRTAMTIRSVQKEFGLDIFGFGRKIHMQMPELWKEINQDWNMIFKDMEVNVSASVEIKNEGLLKSPINVGE